MPTSRSGAAPTPKVIQTFAARLRSLAVHPTSVLWRREDFSTARLTYAVQFSVNLTAWQDSTDTPTVLADDGVNQIVSVPYPPQVGAQQAKFFRIQVTLAP